MVNDIITGIVEGLKQAFIALGKWILTGIINSSYWICLFVAIGALILYLAGIKKAGKYIPLSLILYYVLQSIKAVVK